MKVLMINGGPHKNGCVNRALQEIAETLKKEGIESEFFWVGYSPLQGCTGCYGCMKLGGKCVHKDRVNEFLEIAGLYDGFIFGSPVHFASATGTMTTFMDRVFFAGGFGQNIFKGKPAAVVTSSRRAGATATFDQLNKYLAFSSMPIVPSQYWNEVHGNTPEEVGQDKEGLQIMRLLGNNMAWMLKCFALGRENGLDAPEREEFTPTNFIR